MDLWVPLIPDFSKFLVLTLDESTVDNPPAEEKANTASFLVADLLLG